MQETVLGVAVRSADNGGSLLLVNLPSQARRQTPALPLPQAIDGAGWVYVVAREAGEIDAWRPSSAALAGAGDRQLRLAGFAPSEVTANGDVAAIVSRDPASAIKAVLWAPEPDVVRRLDVFSDASAVPICAQRLSGGRFLLLATAPASTAASSTAARDELVLIDAAGVVRARAVAQDLAAAVQNTVSGPLGCPRAAASSGQGDAAVDRTAVLFGPSHNVLFIDVAGDTLAATRAAPLAQPLAGGEVSMSLFAGGAALALAGGDSEIIVVDPLEPARDTIAVGFQGRVKNVILSADGGVFFVGLSPPGQPDLLFIHSLSGQGEAAIISLAQGEALVDIAEIIK